MHYIVRIHRTYKWINSFAICLMVQRKCAVPFWIYLHIIDGEYQILVDSFQFEFYLVYDWSKNKEEEEEKKTEFNRIVFEMWFLTRMLDYEHFEWINAHFKLNFLSFFQQIEQFNFFLSFFNIPLITFRRWNWDKNFYTSTFPLLFFLPLSNFVAN